MNIFDAFCFFLPLDEPYNNYRRRRETKSQVLLRTLKLEGIKSRKCAKRQNVDDRKI